MKLKKHNRLRRGARAKRKIRELEVPSLRIHRTPRHTYAQLISADGTNILASASTLDKEVRQEVKQGGNIDAAKIIGKVIAKRSLEAGVKQVAFDRAGFKYHGRIKALADTAREVGLEF